MTARRLSIALPLLAALPLAFALTQAPAQDQAEESLTAEGVLDAYLAQSGRDLDGCFRELPELRDAVLGLGLSDTAQREVQASRVVMALDASGSMAGQAGGERKMDAARDAAEAFVSDLPDGVAVGLLAFGHEGNNTEAGREESCAGVEMIHAPGAVDRDEIARSLRAFDATGWTPLAAAIAEAGAHFAASDTPGEQVVYVVSDGEETCGGDPVDAARQLHEGDVRAIVNIIGFDLSAEDRAQLASVAEAGGGAFLEARTGAELRAQLAELQTTLANQSALSRTALHSLLGQATNTINTQTMVSQMRICVSNTTAQEVIGFQSWGPQNDIPSDLRREVMGLLRERGDLYKAQADDIAALAEQLRDEANRVLQDDLDRLQGEGETSD